MCGLAGSFRPLGGEVCSQDVLVAMRDRMTHRGPDGAGVWRETEGRCGFGHRRLAIIDLSDAAAQPMSNENETVVVIFNGEIYNHADLRETLKATGKYHWKTDHSDTEVLLHAYEEWGLECVHRFNGMFAFTIFDKRNPKQVQLHLVRDRMGIKPLYVSRTSDGEWLFASEIRAMFAHPKMTSEMDRTAFWHYLTFIVAPAPLTMFRGVFKIPAGWSVTIDHTGCARANQYWDCKPSKKTTLRENDLGEEEAADEFLRLFRRSISRRMVSDVPFGVLLSGGVDSSMNVALMAEQMDRPVTTFTIGYKGHEDFNEFEFARRISEQYATEHHETLIDGDEAQAFLPELVKLQDEPIADNVCIPLYFLARLVRESGTTVVQVGEGADENFLGYWWCDHYREKYENVYRPALDGNRLPFLSRIFGTRPLQVPGLSGENAEIAARAHAGQELFWGGAVCWWGDLRSRLTPDQGPFQQDVDCPVIGLLPDSYRQLDSHNIVKDHLGDLTGKLVDPEVLQKITYMEHKLRLPEHLLMRVDKMTMAHSIEARVPFLDHEIVEFANRMPPSYKLRDGIGKYIVKKVAGPYLDEDIVYRRKQGFGAPMDRWFMEEDFGRRCQAALDRSQLCREGFFDNDFLGGMLKKQIETGGGYGFHLWTVLNAVLWHEVWIEGNDGAFAG